MNTVSTRMWIGIVAILVFVSGLSLGFAVSTWRVARVPSDAPGYAEAPPPGAPNEQAPFRLPGRASEDSRVSDTLIARLARDPEFTDDQRERLQAVFRARRERLEQFNRDMRERFIAERDSLREEVAAILTPAQLEVFDAMQRPRRRRAPGALRSRRP